MQKKKRAKAILPKGETMTRREVAARLRVARTAVDRAIAAGEIPVLHFQGRQLIPTKAIDRMLEGK